MQHAANNLVARKTQRLQQVLQQIPEQIARGFERRRHRLARAQTQLALLDPTLVLQRGYAWLVDDAGRTITSPDQTLAGQHLRASLASGTLDLLVAKQD